MKIRCVTIFAPVSWPIDQASITVASRLLADARLRLSDAGFEVQATCLATPPFLEVLGSPETELLVEFAQRLEALAHKLHISQVSIGPVLATTPLALLMSIKALPEIIHRTNNVTSGVLFADKYSGINLSAAYSFAEVVHQIAHATPNGVGNTRLAALANIPPFVPFAPAAYHQGSSPVFSMATEAADLAQSATLSAHNLVEAHKKLTQTIETASTSILNVANMLVDDHNIAFNGLDFSLAPYPQNGMSLGAAVEHLGIDAFGGSGTLFATAFFTNAIHQADIPQVAFSGVMLRVLGDEILAQRAAEGRFSVNDLLLYAAIGSGGLDLIPIPGNTTPDEIAALYLDMAALALTTGKPLSARLLPIPNKAVGQKADIDLAGLTSSRILPVKNLGARKLFENNSFLHLESITQLRKRTKSGSYRFASR
jgi:uncharacterized protein (UPF0210 family)